MLCTLYHETLNICCFNVGPASQTVGQHENNIGSMACVCWDAAMTEQDRSEEESSNWLVAL